MVAVRSTGLSLDSIIGYEDDTGTIHRLVDENYLRSVVAVANERFATNRERIDRFRQTLLTKCQISQKSPSSSNNGREDAATRRERKRHEGLLVQQNHRSANSTMSYPEES
jgi:tRNA wybutosine-synthesizing protein 3